MAEISATTFNVLDQEEAFEPYQDLISAEQHITPNVTVDDTIRIKILDRCGMTCHFCHNEGTPVASNVGFQALRVSIYSPDNEIGFTQADITEEDTESFGQTLTDLKNRGLAGEVHWTGGEPTLSKSLPVLTEIARETGYSIKMTSNGQSGERGLAKLADAGLEGVNFSIFGTTPEELAATQAPVFQKNLLLAQNRLRKMDEALVAACGLGLKVKANIVISGESDINRGLRLLENAPEAVKVRYQADTSSRTESLVAIYKLMTELDAKPVSRELVAGCSIDNYDYQLPNGREITFKQTRFSRLPSACDGCPVDKAGECYEGYYGLRLYKDTDDAYWVSPCIQRMNTAEPMDKFLAPKGLGAVVLNHRQQEYNKLIAQHEQAA